MVKPNSADLELMRNWIEADKLRILIDKVYPLARIHEAFAYSETGKATGKVVLKVGQEGEIAQRNRGLFYVSGGLYSTFKGRHLSFPLRRRWQSPTRKEFAGWTGSAFDCRSALDRIEKY